MLIYVKELAFKFIVDKVIILNDKINDKIFEVANNEIKPFSPKNLYPRYTDSKDINNKQTKNISFIVSTFLFV